MEIKSISEIDIPGLVSSNTYTPSPNAWEDKVFYFLLVDRFSDGKETGYIDGNGNIVTVPGTPLFSQGNENNVNHSTWSASGQGWKGGNLKGVKSKLGYLKRMGITALWLSPIFKQVKFQDTYHGYGIQNFLAIDPHFGNEQDLIDLIKTAHSMGIYVILDIILNHSGNVFSYEQGWDKNWDGSKHNVKGFNDASGNPAIPFSVNATNNTDEAVFPKELQDPATFTCKGKISNWDYNPEYREGDFYDLKDINQGYGSTDDYIPSIAFQLITEAYKYWIAKTDVDGFRLDTVKHMDHGATRYFVSVIHEFAQTIGKEKFFLVGEITGGRQNAVHTLEITGLDAALGIDDIPDKMEYLVKGYRNPSDYFNLFRNSELIGKESHAWFRDKIVTMFDDHDAVIDGNNKARFSAKEQGDKVVLNVMVLNALTLGIPCIYYGSEQYFNGQGNSDVFLRETMFGSNFGGRITTGFNFFDESSCAYLEFAKIMKIRDAEIALRRGRQFLRPISGDGINFGIPRMIGNQIRSIIPWSRIMDKQEIVIAINTDYDNSRTAWVTVDNGLNQTGKEFTCLYSTDNNEVGKKIQVTALNGKAVQITVPAAGCVIYK